MTNTTQTETAPEPECSDCGHDADECGRCWCPQDGEAAQDAHRVFVAGGAS